MEMCRRKAILQPGDCLGDSRGNIRPMLRQMQPLFVIASGNQMRNTNHANLTTEIKGVAHD